ncbi:hypothetical protein SAMN05192574_107133 [Mucilaginibacter gossypiicola]|uniref:Uncharacterized protein n=1 Tax=Mucilaginibacter gossypiicola TaxID=551995 RepID=A0A1H8NWW2_9SPHI|nr:hypothetical protein [Mucilaginibacter gossypiicola]SEO34097.1 hypothetical protein SAMN05192574_107133 [Mucilaginibacter gossypiicola]
MKKLLLSFICIVAITCANAQSNQNPTTVYEWNQGGTDITGERIVATINTSAVALYTGATLVGQIIDGTSNWGYTMPVVANFKVFVNFSTPGYGLQQDVVTPNVTLELKSISATQAVLIANCPNPWKQVRILFRYTTGNGPTITLGDPQTITTAGTLRVPKPTYTNELTGRLAINVTNNAKAATYALAVGGAAIAEAVTVQAQSAWPDYVFEKAYPLPSLTEVKNYIDQYGHLPDLPAAKQVNDEGIDLGKMNTLLVKKVEELTLYLLEKDKKEKEQDIINQKNMRQIEQLKNQLKSITKHLNKIQPQFSRK